MDCANTDVFSPIRNFDNEKINRESDGFSEFLKGPDIFRKKSETLENVDENTPVTNIQVHMSNIKSSKTLPKKTAKYEVFSPIRNPEEEKANRQSDGLSEFLKGPDILKKKSVNSVTLVNVDENIPVNNILDIKSSKSYQKKTSKYEINKKEELESSTSMHDSAFTISPENSTSLKKDKSKNAYLSSKRNDKSRTSQQSRADCNDKKKSDSHPVKRNSAKSSLHSGVAAQPKASGSKEAMKTGGPSSTSQHNPLPQTKGDPVSKDSGSKEIKKANEPSSMSQRNPLSLMKDDLASKASGSKEVKAAEPSSVGQRNPSNQLKSGVLERIINDAVESQVDGIQQTLWSHHLNLLKVVNNIQDEMEKRRAESTTMFKIIEELLEENRLLRTALLARQ